MEKVVEDKFPKKNFGKKKILTDIKGEIDRNKIIVGDFNPTHINGQIF